MYIVAYYYAKPAHDRVKTQIAGWMKDAGKLGYDEQVIFTRRLKNRDLQMGKIILDVVREQVVRNNMGDQDQSFHDLFVYFVQKYPNHTKPLLDAMGPERLDRLMPRPKNQEPIVTLDTAGTISSV